MVCIDAYHSNTPDKAVLDGHYYSDKAPGTVALAFPAFAAASALEAGIGVDPNSEFGWLFSSWIACALSIGLITALGGLALFVWLRRYVSGRSALVTTAALFLGAAPLPYSTMMFSHALIVGLLAIAIWAIDAGSELPSEPSRQRGADSWFKTNRRDLVAGFVCGWALASEYSAGLAVAGLFVWLLSMGWRRTGRFAWRPFRRCFSFRLTVGRVSVTPSRWLTVIRPRFRP